jgi:hypothetical protein
MTPTLAPRAVACAAAALFLTASPAFAARYATPSGSDTASCADIAHACSLPTAVDGHGANQPSPNEEIIVEPGTYNLSGPLAPPVSGENIHGTGPLAASIIGATGDIVDPGGTLDRLYLYPSAATAHHVGCSCTGGMLRDSVILGGGSAGGLVGYVGTGPVTGAAKRVTEDYRNDTILSDSSGAVPIRIDHTGNDTSVNFRFTAENVIAATTGVDAQGFPAPGPVATKLSQSKPGQTTTLTMTHSAAGSAWPSSGGSMTITDVSDIAPALPFFQYPINEREVSGAPTIDAGINDPLNGPDDLDGNLRTSGGTTDIGAYEHQVLTLSPTTTPVATNNPPPPPLPIAEPKLKLLNSEVIVDYIQLVDNESGRCTGVKLPCTVHGTLKVRLGGHQKPSAIGTISGTLHPGHKGNLMIKLSSTGYLAVYHASNMRLDAKASVTTTSGLGRTTQTFTVRLITYPDYT